MKNQNKWYEKANKKAEDEMLKAERKGGLGCPGKKKKVLTTEPATPTRLDLGEETVGEERWKY